LQQAEKNFAGNDAALKRISEARGGLNPTGDVETAQDPSPTQQAQAPSPSQEDVDAAQSMSDDERREMIEGMVSRLAERLNDEGGSVDEWLRLVRSYAVLGRRDDARQALDKAASKFSSDKAALGQLEEARTQFGLTSE
jgi:cytochrome c-type biogenesis protein CcmH